jgi:hypothetical protein
MSLSIHKQPKKVEERQKYGVAIAVIESNDRNLNKKYLYLNTSDIFNESNKTSIELPKGAKFCPVPLRKTTSRVYISGPSGSGKSTLSSKFIQQYHRIFPDDTVYLISTVDRDDVLDKLDYIERVEISDEMGHWDIEDNCLTIFDDVGTIHDKITRNSVMSYRDKLLEAGRHFNHSVLATSHLFSDFKTTRLVLLESRKIVVFPRAGGKSAIFKGLKNYVGMDKKEIEKVCKLKSRWVMIQKDFPNLVLYEGGSYLLE